jgi:hypothetical protein
MPKKRTKMERNLKSGPRRRKRQPYGVPLKRRAEGLAVLAAIVNRRRPKNPNGD